ncbi:MAG: dTDP-4-dehydrorhamnose reductase [Acidobacteria bacterium]|nr:dTDP-4-dehydrorhamnose reductase [Acidobacteriota bacterium]
MKILITGARGNVGRELSEHCKLLGDNVVACSSADLDITEKDAVLRRVASEKCDAVVNCAAWTDVDGCEGDVTKNFAVNSAGVENLAIACRENETSFLTISTDFVFDGEKSGFYNEEDPTNPINQYGRAKLEGEQRAASAWRRSVIVRAGWVFGPYGKNFISTVDEQLRAGETVTAISDSYGTPTYSADLAARLRELLALDRPGIYHVANGGDGVSYAEFARLAAPSGGQVIDIPGASLKRPARRPKNSRLECLEILRAGLAPLPPLNESLARHLKRKSEADHK